MSLSSYVEILKFMSKKQEILSDCPDIGSCSFI